MANDSVASSELESLSHNDNEAVVTQHDPDISLVTVDKNQVPRRGKRHEIVHLDDDQVVYLGNTYSKEQD